MEDSILLQLRKPVTLGSMTWTELALTEPTLGQLVDSNAAGTPMQQMAALIAVNAKVSPAVVRALCQRDAQDAIDFFARFERPTAPTLGTGQPASAASTPGPLGT